MTATVAGALAEATARLRAAGVPEPARDARRLLAAALGVPAGELTVRRDAALGAADAAFTRFVDERSRFRPVAQIVGRRVFWGRDFAVTGDVLDPRPETETLVAAALAGPPAGRLLDLGTGSGALLVTLLAEWPAARGLGTDISPAALAVAAANAARHGVAGRAELRLVDWTDGIDGGFDLVVCNPPYVAAGEMAALDRDVREWEPRLALTPGPTGIESYRRIAGGLGRLLGPGGRALLEIGPRQAAAVAEVFAAAGLAVAAVHPDLDGRDRVVELRP